MNAHNPFLTALAVLFAIHTAVSAAAYRWLTKTRVEQMPPGAIIETTTSEQAQRGEKVFIANKRTVSHSVPWPVPCYVIGGYAGLLVAVLLWAFYRSRAGQAAL
jgi:hypothetical protein